MISGRVNANLEATVRLLVRGSGRPEQDVEAVIDTGFNGFLIIPPTVIRRLGLLRIGRSRVVLASGKEEVLDLYEIDVLWDGQWRTVEAEAAETDALVGMSLLYRYSLYVEAVEGGRAVINPLP